MFAFLVDLGNRVVCKVECDLLFFVQWLPGFAGVLFGLLIFIKFSQRFIEVLLRTNVAWVTFAVD